MVTFEDIKKANESVSTLAIKRVDKKGNVISKEYVEVNQRTKAFRMVYPTGTIETFQTRLDGEMGSRVVEYSCNVYANIDGERILLASGTAEEKESSTFINQTSFIENCETSSVGRALGFAGFGIDTSIASFEEVKNAMANQEAPAEKITKDQWETINKAYTKEEVKAMYKELGITKGADMPREYASKKIEEYLANIKNELPAKEFY